MKTLLTALGRVLQWLRVTNGDGNLSLTYLFVYLTAVVYYLHPDAVTAATVAAAVANYAVKTKVLPFLQNKADDAAAARLAEMQHELAKQQVAADVEKLHRKVAELAEFTQKLATPERLEAVKRMSGQSLSPAPRVPTRL